MFESIENKIIDTDLFSGSIDAFRTAYGGFYQKVEIVTEYTTDSLIEFQPANNTDPRSPYLAAVYLSEDHPYLIDEEALSLAMKIPMRVYGSADEVKSDHHWKTLWIGGSFGDVIHTPLYNEWVHSYYIASDFLPYAKIDAKTMEELGESPARVIEISYEYSGYLPEYQNYIKIIDSELLIPSYYVLWDFVMWQKDTEVAFDTEDPALIYGTEFINYISIEKTAFMEFEPDCLFTYNEAKTPLGLPGGTVTDGSYEIRNSYLATEYLTSSYIQNQLSSSTREWAEDRMRHMLFNADAVDRINTSFDIFEDSGSMLPYKITLELDTYLGEGSDWYAGDYADWAPLTYFADSIRENNFSSRFIKTLYEAYSGKVDSLMPEETQYSVNSQYSSVSIEENTLTDLIETQNISYKEIDYLKFLSYCHNNYKSTDEGCYLVGPRTLEIRSAIDDKGTYRFFNSDASLGVLKDTMQLLYGGRDTDTLSTTINQREPLLEDIFGESDGLKECLIEPLAYRIEKHKGPYNNNASISDAIQNFWFFAPASESDWFDPTTDMSPGNFAFYDNQVLYDQDYTYKIYVYMLVSGYRYKYSDLALSRQLGCSGITHEHGLEFYNPYSVDEETTNILYTDEDTMEMLEEENEYGTDSQIFADYPYAADFYFNWEPYAKIVEMPIYTKTLKVLDNPTNRLTIIPYQVAGNSQKIGFEFHTTAFVETTFPSIISDDDEEYKIDYMHAKDILENEELVLETIAEPRYVEIYRLAERPTAVTDFDAAKIAEIDLVVEDSSQYSYKSAFYDDKIKTNQKYYYLFRVLNQQRILSRLSEIYEAQLINDGGYKYTIFNVLYEHDLEQEVFNNPSKNFKKIFQLQPNLDQLQFVVDELDFNESAASQLENLEVGLSEDSIWDKTFKIRLTSKKTGRKIDLNITYRLNSD